MKKIQVLVAFAAVCASSMAVAYPANPFYIAASAGIFHANYNQQLNDQVATGAQDFSGNAEQHGYSAGLPNDTFYTCYRNRLAQCGLRRGCDCRPKWQ